MKNLVQIITICFLLSSCAVTNTHNLNDSMQSRAFIELDINDITYLGKTEISYEYSRYLFIFTRLISINNEKPNNGIKNYVNLQTSGFSSFFEPNMKRALYKAYLKFPDADYMEITERNTKTQRMFLGRKNKKSAIVKAYKYQYENK